MFLPILDSIDDPSADITLLRARVQFTKLIRSERHKIADRHFQVELDFTLYSQVVRYSWVVLILACPSRSQDRSANYVDELGGEIFILTRPNTYTVRSF